MKKSALIIIGFFVLMMGCSSSSSDTGTGSVTFTEDNFKSFTPTDLEGITLEWRTTTNTLLEVRVSAETTGWVGVGFEPSGSQMSGANIILGYVDGSDVILEDHYGSSQTAHTEDTQSNITLISGTEENGVTTLWFTTPYISSDTAHDQPITSGNTVTVLLAYGSNSSDDTTTTHGSGRRIRTTINDF